MICVDCTEEAKPHCTRCAECHAKRRKETKRKSRNKRLEYYRAFSRTYCKQYYKDNAERIRKRSNTYYHQQKEQCKKRQQNYRRTHTKSLNNQVQAWRRQNKERVKAYVENYRARRRFAKGTFTGSDFDQVLHDQDNKCFDCSKPFTQDFPPEVGHAVPLSRGGSNWPSNIIAQCRSCNARQGSTIHPKFKGNVA